MALRIMEQTLQVTGKRIEVPIAFTADMRQILSPCNGSRQAPVPNLVAEAMQLKTLVGDGLDDSELTELLKSKLSPVDGFRILCFSHGKLTLGVPAQGGTGWFGSTGTIAPAKEAVARTIADQHRLTLCEPPDKLVYGSPRPGAHRHLEFANRWRTVAVAHPLYIKLRVCGGGEHENVPVESEAAIAQCATLFRDLAALYREAGTGT